MMQTRTFGKTGVTTSRIGYGAMPLSLRDRPDEATSGELLDAVLAAGVRIIDTADSYCLFPDELHHNERLVAAAVARSGADVIVATKGGTRRTEAGWEVDGRPEFLAQSIEASFAALGGKYPIPLWQLHWPDPRFSIRQMLAPVADAAATGLVRWVGLCNVSVAQLQEAIDCLPIVAVQNQFNFWRREAETEGVIEFCERHGLVFLPWRPLGGLGLAEHLADSAPLEQIARERGVSPQRLAIAWLLAKSPCILPIPGSRHLDHVRDCLAAQDLQLDAAEISKLDALSPDELPGRKRPAAWIDRPPLASLAE